MLVMILLENNHEIARAMIGYKSSLYLTIRIRAGNFYRLVK